MGRKIVDTETAYEALALRKNPHKFSSTNQPPPEKKRVRKSKFLHLKDKFSLTKDDVNHIIEYQFSLSIEELTALFKNKDITAIEKAFAAAILKSARTGDLSQIDKLLDRKIGRIPASIDMTADGNSLPISIVLMPVSVPQLEKEINPIETVEN